MVLFALADSRKEQIEKAVAAGKHIISEKPIADSPEKQWQAVELAAQEELLILTGGPGTGKTTSVRGIAALFERMGLDVLLCAPTGRAAKRMGELCGKEAQTIHRLLGAAWAAEGDEHTFR